MCLALAGTCRPVVFHSFFIAFVLHRVLVELTPSSTMWVGLHLNLRLVRTPTSMAMVFSKRDNENQRIIIIIIIIIISTFSHPAAGWRATPRSQSGR